MNGKVTNNQWSLLHFNVTIGQQIYSKTVMSRGRKMIVALPS